MGGSTDQSIVIWQYALNASWVLLPLVPSVMIYLIFPRTTTSLGGPFAGLTIRASGAFAAYFLVLLATLPLLNRQNQNIEDLLRPSWEISGTVRLEDENGKEIPYDNGSASPLTLELDPKLVRPVGRRGFRLRVPEVDNTVPAIYVRHPDVGTTKIDPLNPEEGETVKIDPAKKTIRIMTPVVIRRMACVGLACGTQP